MAIQGLLFVLLQTRERFRDPQFGDKARQLERMLAATERPSLLLALGSSRTGMGFRGDLVGEMLSGTLNRNVVAFNFGIPAVGPVMELTYLRRLLGDGVRPDLLLLELHPAMLSSHDGKPIEKRGLFVEQLRHSEIDSIQEFGYLDTDADPRWWEANACPVSAARFPLLGRLLPNWLPASARFDWGRRTDPWGWNACPWVDPTAQLRESALREARHEYGEIYTQFRLQPAPVRAFQQTLALARENGIPVVLVLMPEGPTFRSWCPEAIKRQIDSFVASLGTPLIDAREWVGEDDFLDSHHLLQTGARKFSERLGEELKRLAPTSPIR